MKTRNKLLCASLAAILTLATSCEDFTIGLGTSVDVEQPVVSVTYPPEASIIRGSFVAAGTCTDDKKVTDVEVRIRKSDSLKVLKTVKAKIDGNTWRADISNELTDEGQELLDGQYIIDVVASDAAKHQSTPASASYDLDNTAPCLIISKPLAVGDEDPSVFGQTIKIAGDISEEHSTVSLTLHLQEWDPVAKQLKEGTQKDIAVTDFATMTSDNPLVIAKYYTDAQIEAEEEDAKKNSLIALRDKYLEIYNSTSGSDLVSVGSKIFYASVQLADNAKEYLNPGDSGTGVGNESKVYYINSSDFYDNLMKESAYNLTATKLRKVINGTSTDYAEKEKDLIKEELKKYEIESSKESLSENSSVFLVNPENNPHYIVTDYECGAENNSNIVSSQETLNGYRNFYLNSSLTVSLEGGRDSVNIDPSTVSIMAYRMDSAEDRIISNKNAANHSAWEILSPGDWTGAPGTNLGTTFSIRNTEENNGVYTDTFFEAGVFYRIVVNGTDLDGNDILSKCDDGYGFQIFSSSNPPVIRITTIQDNYISGDTLANTGLPIEFTVTTAGPTIGLANEYEPSKRNDSIRVYKGADEKIEGITVTNLSTNESQLLPLQLKEVKVGDRSGNTYPVKIVLGGKGVYVPTDAQGNEIPGKYKYTFAVGAVDSVYSSSTAPFTFYVNNEAPKIQNVRISPVEEGKKVNGQISFSANASTNYEMESIEYSVYVGGNKVASGKTDGSSSAFGSLSAPQAVFDTAKDASYNNKPLKIEIVATDKVGNKLTHTIDGYTIDQESDIPQLSVQGFSTEIAKENISETNGNVFDKNGKIVGSFQDVDGLASVTYKIQRENGTVVSSGALTKVSGALFTIPVPKESGYFKVTLTAQDSTYASGTSTTKAYRTITKEFWIAIDGTVPTIAVKSIDGSTDNVSSSSVQYKKTDSVAYVGTIYDDWAEERIDVYVNDVLQETKPVISNTANADGSKNWTFTLNLAGKTEGNYTVKFVAFDKAGKSKEIQSVISRDKTAPVFGTGASSSAQPKLYISSPLINGWTKENSVEIRGYVSDVSSPIASVECSVDGASWRALNMSYTVSAGVEDRKQLIYTGTIDGLVNGDTVRVRAKDLAGNEQTAISGAVKIDRNAPSVELTHYADKFTSGTTNPAYIMSTGTVTANNKKDLWLKGTLSDVVAAGSGASGTTAVYFKLKSAASTSSYDYKVEADAGKTITDWNIKVTKESLAAAFGSSSSSAYLYALVKDMAGNETSIPLTTIIYDVTCPSASITSIKYFGTEKVVSGALNKKVTFEGTASDNQKVNSVRLEYSADKESWRQYGSSIENSNSWSITVNTEDTVFQNNKTYYFRAVAVDSIGNTGNSGSSSTAYDEGTVKTLLIDQSSDIPVLSFSNLTFVSGMSASKTSWLKKTNDMYISVSDDDGVESIEYTTESGDSGWIPVSSGKITLGDASYTVRFRVKDVAGKTFTSGTANSPVLRDETQTAAETTGVLYLSIDKTPPAIAGREFLLWDGTKYPAAGDGVSNTTALKFGGEKNKLKITLRASDSNGINSVYVKCGEKIWNGVCADADWSDDAEHQWTVEVKDSGADDYIQNLASDIYEMSLVVEDTAGSTNEKVFTLNVDNTPAILKVDSHSQDQLVGNAFILKGMVEDSDTETQIKFLVNASATPITNWNDSNLSEYTGTVASWRIAVDGATAADDGVTHTKSLKDLFVDVYGPIKGITLNSENNVVTKDASGKPTSTRYRDIENLYFHFITKDSVGNMSNTAFRLKVDPQGDLPSVRMTYPVPTNVAENSTTLSGPVRAQGEATTMGENTVMGVYMQIDPSYSGTFNEAAWKKTGTNNPVNSIVSPSLKSGTSPAKLSEIYTNDSGNTLFENVYARYNAQDGIASTKKKIENTSTGVYNEYAIYLGNKTSWNITINRSGELNGANKTQNTVAVRLIVVDSAGNITKTEPMIITLDSDAPIFGSQEFYVYQYAWINKTSKKTVYSNTASPKAGDHLYSDSGCNVLAGENWSSTGYTANFASAPYYDDMSLKGEWWLSGSVEDDNDIWKIEEVSSSTSYQIVLKDNAAEGGSYTIDNKAGPKSTVTRYKSDAGNNGFVFNLRVGSDEENSFAKLSYTIRAYEYNTNPDLRKSSEKIFSINYDNKAPDVDESGSFFNMSTNVANSYGFYTLGTAAYENGKDGFTQSGFARAVFYFTKSTDVFDSYIRKGKTGNTLASSGLTKMNGLYWKSATVSNVNGAAITISASDVNIHKGGLVLLGGTYYTITDKSGTLVTLDKNPSEQLKGAPVYFALGHVVDQEGEETDGTVFETTADEGYGYYTNSNDNRDDFMIESVAKSVGRTIWKGSVNSANIPDGPAVLHYVVFDAAGNYTEKSLNVLVGNNAPRLASVRVWSDFDGNGVENPNGKETRRYYYAERNRTISGAPRAPKATDVTSNLIVRGANSSAFMTIKDKVTFVPEIVGGTGDLYYSYKIGNGAETRVNTKFGTGHDDGNLFQPETGSYLLSDDFGETYIDGHTGYGTNDATEYKFEVPGSSLSSLNGNTEFQFTIWDSAVGSTRWDADKCLHASMNVLLNVKYADTSNPRVNVKRFAYESEESNNLYKNSAENGHIELEKDLTSEILTKLGDDPKVSGKITIRGTAYDDVRLKELYVSFTGHSKIGSSTKAATYTNGLWVSASSDTEANMASNGWTFTVTSDDNSETSHIINWECNIDTSFIAMKAELDRVFTFTAKDERGNNGSGLSSPTGTNGSDETKLDDFNRPSYRMDVVPYISKVITQLSATDISNPSVYARTTLGHYPVYHETQGFKNGAASWNKEVVEIHGFNFDFTAGKDYLEYEPEDTAEYVASQNSITCLNNINNSNAPYNMQPNGVNNNLLSDDVFFDVWQFNSKAAMPRSGKADNLVMKINPVNDQIGFAFSNSSEYFSMPSETESYRQWSRSYDYLRHNALAYDGTGNSFACTVGGDLNSTANYSDTFDLFIGSWGTVDNPGQGYQNFTNGNTKGIMLDRIGQNKTKAGAGGYLKNKNRFESQSFATLRNSFGTGTYLYLAYYDAINDEIRLKTGGFMDDPAKVTANTKFGQFTQAAGNIEAYKTDKVQLIADGTENTLGKAGSYLSLGVTSNNYLVLAWFDGTDMWYTYSTKPSTEFTTFAGHNGSTNTKNDWAPAEKIMEGAGKYCKLAVDGANGVHVAGYDVANSCLKYVYIPTATAPETRKSSVVDAYLDIGEQLTIDVAKVGDYQIPYIGYWGGFNERPRHAYLNKAQEFYASDNGLDGVDSSDGNDLYTGVWECTPIPTPNVANKNLISVGVWKNASGELAYSTTGTNRGTASGTNSYTSSTASNIRGNCYGNGTNNSVVAYTVNMGGVNRWVETAQLK